MVSILDIIESFCFFSIYLLIIRINKFFLEFDQVQTPSTKEMKSLYENRLREEIDEWSTVIVRATKQEEKYEKQHIYFG